MRLMVVFNNSKKIKMFNCSTQPMSHTSTRKNKIFHNIDELLTYAISLNNDNYIISISSEIYDHIKKTNHDILKYKNFMFV
jgi:hypothetical protein